MIKHAVNSSILGLVLMFITSSHAHAKDNFLVLNTFAYHFKNNKDRNSAVPGIGFEQSPAGRIGWHLGTFSDSFGAQASYAGLNYSTPYTRILGPRMRFLIGATALRKQYHLDTEVETKIVPLPALEIGLTRNAVLNVSGSPEIDYQGSHSNAVMFFQLKLNIE